MDACTRTVCTRTVAFGLVAIGAVQVCEKSLNVVLSGGVETIYSHLSVAHIVVLENSCQIWLKSVGASVPPLTLSLYFYSVCVLCCQQQCTRSSEARPRVMFWRPAKRLVDATIGLERKLVILVMEVKSDTKSFQYDLKRLVPALTRCSCGLVVMWKDGAREGLPMDQLANRPKGVLTNLLGWDFEPDPRVVRMYNRS